MMSNKHLSVESLYLYADHVFGYGRAKLLWRRYGRIQEAF